MSWSHVSVHSHTRLILFLIFEKRSDNEYRNVIRSPISTARYPPSIQNWRRWKPLHNCWTQVSVSTFFGWLETYQTVSETMSMSTTGLMLFPTWVLLLFLDGFKCSVFSIPIIRVPSYSFHSTQQSFFLNNIQTLNLQSAMFRLHCCLKLSDQ